MFRSNWTILREHWLSLAKVTILWNQSVKVHRLIPQYCDFSKAQRTLPEDGPIGPKHIGAKEIF